MSKKKSKNLNGLTDLKNVQNNEKSLLEIDTVEDLELAKLLL